MSKKQRDSLYAEVQKHQQQSREFAGAEACEDGGETGGARGPAFSRGGGGGAAFSEQDDMGALPEGLLFDLPLTPDYCALDVTGGGGGGGSGGGGGGGGSSGGGSGGGGSAGSSSSSQSSPEQSGGLDFVDANHHIRHEYQLLQDSGLFSRAVANPPADGCSGLELGEENGRVHHVNTYTSLTRTPR